MAGIRRDRVTKAETRKQEIKLAHEKIQALKEQGLNNAEIAKKFGINESTVRAVGECPYDKAYLLKTTNIDKPTNQKVTDTFIAEITVCYEIPENGELMSKEDYEMFLKSCYDDAHVRKLKHFIEE